MMSKHIQICSLEALLAFVTTVELQGFESQVSLSLLLAGRSSFEATIPSLISHPLLPGPGQLSSVGARTILAQGG